MERKGFFVSEQHFRQVVYHHLIDMGEKMDAVADILKGMQKELSDTQSQINTMVTQLTAIENDLKAEWASLQSQVNAGQVPDLSGLQAVVSSFTADDAVWKQPITPPAAPTT